MKYLENTRKPVQVEHGCLALSFALVLRPYDVDYLHLASYVCVPCASNVGDVGDALIHFTYICEVLAINHMQMRWLQLT